jgi:hypothetical protein
LFLFVSLSIKFLPTNCECNTNTLSVKSLNATMVLMIEVRILGKRTNWKGHRVPLLQSNPLPNSNSCDLSLFIRLSSQLNGQKFYAVNDLQQLKGFICIEGLIWTSVWSRETWKSSLIIAAWFQEQECILKPRHKIDEKYHIFQSFFFKKKYTRYKEW